jgi:hypothetical protein
MKYEKLFKKILIESKKQELFKKILREGEEESVDDILRAYRQSKSSEAYEKNQTVITNNKHQIDIINDNKPRNNQISKSPVPDTSFEDYLNRYLDTDQDH